MSEEKMLSLDDVPAEAEASQAPGNKPLLLIAVLLGVVTLVELGLGGWLVMQSGRIGELAPKVAKAAKLQKDQTAHVAELQEALDALTARVAELEKGQSVFGPAGVADTTAPGQATEPAGGRIEAKPASGQPAVDKARVVVGGESMNLKDMLSTIETMNRMETAPAKKR